MPPRRTTTTTANTCFSTVISKLGESAAMDVRGHCGMPLNNVTKQAGGTEAYVACFNKEIGATTPGNPHEATRQAAQKCSQQL
jgi:hypothetical protein